jgi:NAD(P)H-hydrate repair Nnr-like enzyme with NAD(P)H-hydrate epimerase domain
MIPEVRACSRYPVITAPTGVSTERRSPVGATRESWAAIPLDERRRRTQNARRKHAVQTIVKEWDELSDEDQDLIVDAIFPSGDAA